MKSTGFKSIGSPIKLRLEFESVTVAELSNVLRQWNALLLLAWRESYVIHYRGRAPKAHILITSASTANSFEVLSDIALAMALAASVFGPTKEWPSVARTAYGYLASIWRQRSIERSADSLEHVYLRGGDTPEIRISVDALANKEVGERIERMWETANSGGIRLVVEEPTDAHDNSTESEDVEPGH